MSTREVWFAIPSANPELCRRTLPFWRERGYRIAVLQNHRRGDIPADIVRWVDEYPGWAGSINMLARDVAPRSADIIVSGGDDMLPVMEHSAQELAEQFFKRFPDGFGVMQPHGDDWGMVNHYCGSPWLGRGWIDRAYGGRGPMNPDYHHNWADCELFWVAKCMGVLWSRPEITQRHEHFLRSGGAKPDYWRSVERNGASDLLRLLERKQEYFPGAVPDPSYPFDTRPIDEDVFRFAERRATQYLRGFVREARGRERMTAALRALSDAGLKRIALYGAGAHTRDLGATLRECPVEIGCIIDDDLSRQNKRLWNFPVVSARDALSGFGIEAALISSDTRETEIWEASARLRRAGLPVLRVYNGPGVLADLTEQRKVAHAVA